MENEWSLFFPLSKQPKLMPIQIVFGSADARVKCDELLQLKFDIRIQLCMHAPDTYMATVELLKEIISDI